MRLFRLSFLLSLLLSAAAFAQDGSSVTPSAFQIVEEEDASPSCAGSTIKVTNTTLTDNADGTCSVATGGTATTGWTDDGSSVSLTTNTDNVSIGTDTAGGKLFIDGDTDEIQLQVQANTTQTTLPFVVENSAGTDVFTVSNTGTVTVAGTPTITAGSGGLDFVSSNVIFVGIGDDIETAITNATAGDTLLLAAGTYSIPNEVTVGKSIRLRGQGRDATTLDFTVSGTSTASLLSIEASNVSVENMTLSYSGSNNCNPCVAIEVDGTAGTQLSGIDLWNLDVSASGAGTVRTIFIKDASGTIRELTASATSTAVGNDDAEAIFVNGLSTQEAAATWTISDTLLTADAQGGAAGDDANAIRAAESAATQNITVTFIDSTLTATAAGSGAATGANTSGNNIIFIFGQCVVSGGTTDVTQASSSSVTLRNTNLINNTMSGTITFQGTSAMNAIQLGQTGVNITHDSDGALTFLGTSAGSDENLTLNLDDTANTAVWSTSTGVTSWTLTGMGLTSTSTSDFGWSVQSAANQACNTTCTSACVFGEDTAVVGTVVACTDATADVCVCAGAN